MINAFNAPYVVAAVCAVVMIVFGLITDKINRNKGYKSGFLWGFFLGILGLLIVALRPAAAHSIDPQERSAKLEKSLAEAQELLDKGIITNEEYAERRKKILENVS